MKDLGYSRNIAFAWLLPGTTIFRFWIQNGSDDSVRHADGWVQAAIMIAAVGTAGAGVWALVSGDVARLLFTTVLMGAVGAICASAQDWARIAINCAIACGACLALCWVLRSPRGESN